MHASPTRSRKTPGHGALLDAIPGSVWPLHSLFNKFRRLCHRNEAPCSSSITVLKTAVFSQPFCTVNTQHMLQILTCSLLYMYVNSRVLKPFHKNKRMRSRRKGRVWANTIPLYGPWNFSHLLNYMYITLVCHYMYVYSHVIKLHLHVVFRLTMIQNHSRLLANDGPPLQASWNCPYWPGEGEKLTVVALYS